MKYEVMWTKTYYTTGTETVEATSEEHAEQLVEDRVGDLTGNMQYDPNETEVTVLGELPATSLAEAIAEDKTLKL